MRKFRRAFTLIEMVVTLAVLGVSVALTGVVIANVSRVQSASASQYSYNTQVDAVEKMTREYISYVSLNTSAGAHGVDISFSNVSLDKQTITFVDDQVSPVSYQLVHADNQLKIVFGEGHYFSDESFAHTLPSPIDIPDVKDYEVSYSSTLGVLSVKYMLNGKEYHVNGVVRTY